MADKLLRTAAVVLLTLFVTGCPNGPFSSDSSGIATSTVEPDDPYYLDGSQWYLKMTNVAEAWQLVATQENAGRARVASVAVIDSTVETTHDDLSSVIADGGAQFLTDASEGEKLPDDHGTHVAGLVGARGGNGIGVAGTAYNGYPRVLVPVIGIASLPSNGNGSLGDLVDAIRYAAGIPVNGKQLDTPADVINMSLGVADLAEDARSFLHAAILDAAARDIVIVAAAGNGEPGRPVLDYPARFPEVISVASIDADRELSSFSHHGPDLDVVAPGGIKRTSSGGFSLILSTITGNGYGEAAGTSMAAPQVAAIAALIRVVNPDLSASQVRTILHNTAIDLGEPDRDDTFGYGLVDANAAIRRALNLGSDTVLRGRSTELEPARTFALDPASIQWSPGQPRTVLVRFDPDHLNTLGITDPVEYVQSATGIPASGDENLVRLVVPEDRDGRAVLEQLNALEGVRIAVQDRVIAWR